MTNRSRSLERPVSAPAAASVPHVVWSRKRGGIPGLAILGEYEPGPPAAIILYEPDIEDRAQALGEPVARVAAQALAHELYHHLVTAGHIAPQPGISEEQAARAFAAGCLSTDEHGWTLMSDVGCRMSDV